MTVVHVAGALALGFVLGSAFTVLVRRKQRACFHHISSTGETWLVGYLIDAGMRKLWQCRECGQTWGT